MTRFTNAALEACIHQAMMTIRISQWTILSARKMISGYEATMRHFPHFQGTTKQALQCLLFPISPLPVCGLSSLPCGAPRGRTAEPSGISGSGGRVESPVAMSARHSATVRAEPRDTAEESVRGSSSLS